MSELVLGEKRFEYLTDIERDYNVGQAFLPVHFA
jgi:hypothetical protein